MKCQGLQRLQPCTTHRNTGKICHSPKTMLINRTHIQQNHIQDHHQKYWDIHWLQSGCQTRIHNGPIPISVPDSGLLQNTGILVGCPGTNKIPISTQRKLTKINWRTSDPPTRHLHIWIAFWSILHDLCIQRWISLWIQEWPQKRNDPPLRLLHLVWPLN